MFLLAESLGLKRSLVHLHLFLLFVDLVIHIVGFFRCFY